MKEQPDKPSAYQRAAFWSGRVTNAGFQMVVPGLLGHLVDRQLKTQVVFTMLGFLAGMALAIRGLMNLSKALGQSEAKDASGRSDK